MSKAKEILEKLKQRREEGEAVRAYWLELFPELGELNQIQANTWLIQYDIDTVIAGLESAAIKVNKVDHAVENGRGEEMTAMRVVKYASMCMRNTGLTEEERQAKDQKAKELRAKRSAAGKLGNAKRWHSQPEVATVCDDLRSGCDDLHRGTGTGSGTGTGTLTGRGTGTSTGRAAAQSGKEEKATSKPETKTNPVRGVSANREAKPTPEPTIFGEPIPANFCAYHREEVIAATRMADLVSGDAVNKVMRASEKCAECNPKKPKTLKTARGEQPKPDSFDAWTNVERTEWINCTCEFYEWGSLSHGKGCTLTVKPEAKAAAAGDYGLGTVDDLTSGDWITTKDGYKIRGL